MSREKNPILGPVSSQRARTKILPSRKTGLRILVVGSTNIVFVFIVAWRNVVLMIMSLA